MVLPQGSAKTKDDAEKALEETTRLDGEVSAMMEQLEDAEQELSRKKAEAAADMMMAGMVSTKSSSSSHEWIGIYIILKCITLTV